MFCVCFGLLARTSVSEIVQYSDTVRENTSFFIINSQPIHFMRIEYSFSFKFATENCCPIFRLDDCTEPHCHEPNELGTILKWTNKINLRLATGPEGSKEAGCSYQNGNIQCTGTTQKLLYEPRQMYFILGYNCKNITSLNGLSYNISAKISNKTDCISVNINNCPHIKYASFPNSFGESTVHGALLLFDSLKFALSLAKIPCLKESYSHLLLCNTVFYQCPGPGQQSSLIAPCRETCIQAVEACKETFPQFAHFNCTAQPSYKKSNSCLTYEPSMYEPPSNTKMKLQILVIVITISCAVPVACITVVAICLLQRKRRCKHKQNSFAMEYHGTRNKSYDAFISYHDDSLKATHPQKDIVFKTLLPFLEQECEPSFEVLTHPRNFIAGNPIKDSIRKAIWNSNAIIILMSKEYTESMWCRYEFEESVYENTKDRAFRMIVIMLDSVENLGELTPEMDTFFRTKTYLEMNDPELLQKIKNILHSIRSS